VLILKFLRNLEIKEKHNLYNLPGVNTPLKGIFKESEVYNSYELDENLNPKARYISVP